MTQPLNRAYLPRRPLKAWSEGDFTLDALEVGLAFAPAAAFLAAEAAAMVSAAATAAAIHAPVFALTERLDARRMPSAPRVQSACLALGLALAWSREPMSVCLRFAVLRSSRAYRVVI